MQYVVIFVDLTIDAFKRRVDRVATIVHFSWIACFTISDCFEYLEESDIVIKQAAALLVGERSWIPMKGRFD